MENDNDKLPIIIIGAGIVGLTLAQALKQADIPFEIFERNSEHDSAQGGGWAITVHWALPAFEECLPSSMFDQLAGIQVDPEFARNDTGKFLFLNLSNGQAKYNIPPSKRMRIHRRLLRSLLCQGIDVKYEKSLISYDISEDSGIVEAVFSDGSRAKGCLLVGADGSNSKTRHLLMGADSAKLQPLPIRAFGVTNRMTEDQVAPLRQIDPLLFQGCHPSTGVFQWFSIVSTPLINGSESSTNPYYEGQLFQSWRYRTADDEVPATDAERLAKMKSHAQHFEARIRQAIEDLPEDTKVLEIKLADWPTVKWTNMNGRVTLAGDSAHPMTMYRGEAFNHGITDAAILSKELKEIWKSKDARGTIQSAVVRYEDEMQARTHEAVLLSRQACLDAHDLNALAGDSPLVSKRTRKLEPGSMVS